MILIILIFLVFLDNNEKIKTDKNEKVNEFFFMLKLS